MTSLIERGITIARQQVDADNAHDVQAVASFFAPGFRLYLNGMLQSTAGDAGALYRAIPDAALTIEWLDGTNDLLVHQFSVRGTFMNHLGAMPPTGKPVEVHGCTIMQHDGRQFSCFWRGWDSAEFGRWLGGAKRAPGRSSAARQGGNMPFGSPRETAERVGADLAGLLEDAEKQGELRQVLALFADPIIEGVWGRRRLHHHAALLAEAGKSLPIGGPREVHQRLVIGDRVVERFTSTWDSPDGAVTLAGCMVFEHDGSRFTRVWSYVEDYDRVVAGVYGRTDD